MFSEKRAEKPRSAEISAWPGVVKALTRACHAISPTGARDIETRWCTMATRCRDHAQERSDQVGNRTANHIERSPPPFAKSNPCRATCGWNTQRTRTTKIGETLFYRRLSRGISPSLAMRTGKRIRCRTVHDTTEGIDTVISGGQPTGFREHGAHDAAPAVRLRMADAAAERRVRFGMDGGAAHLPQPRRQWGQDQRAGHETLGGRQ